MIGAATLNFTVPALTIAPCIVVAESQTYEEQMCPNVEYVDAIFGICGCQMWNMRG